MARSVSIPHRSSTGRDGSALPPRSGGGGDGRDGGDSMPDYGERLRHARRALAIFITPVLMLFISFTVVYLLRRGFVSGDMGNPADLRKWVPVRLPWTVLLANSAVLVLSSITIERARRSITWEAALAPVKSIPGVSLGDERAVPWLGITTFLGFVFLAVQLFLWKELSTHGFHMMGGTSSSFVYILTAMHGVHLAGGILALTFAAVASVLGRPVEYRRIVVDITAWYWHFMTLLWIYIVVLLWFVAE